MTKEVEENAGVKKNDIAVSTSTEFSQNTLEKNSSVKLESDRSNNSNDIKEDGISNKSLISEESKNEIKSTQGNLGSDKMGNGVRNNSNETGMVETSRDSKEKNEEIEEEDVPGDFFDDFFKEDFMEGLDIVDDDAWDEEKMKKEIATGKKPKEIVEGKVEKEKLKKKKPKSLNKIDHVERFHASPPGEKKHKQKKKKREEKSEKSSEQKQKKSKDKIIDADEFDIRRDPEKTKRDIERDKARCEKDKEKKIISEKLSLVETGLVPPGMEMEIDIEEVKRQKDRIEQNKPPRDLRERLRSLRSRSKSVTRKQRSPKVNVTRKSISPIRRPSPKRRRTRSPIRGRSPGHVSPLRKTSLKKSPLNTTVRTITRRSPLRRSSPRRSPLRRSQERRPLRRSRSHSPYYRSRRTRYSPIHRHRARSNSRESEREIWLKRRRSRSRTPRRKREEKKSFLQEIAEKLNETRPQQVNMIPSLQPSMHFVHSQPMQSTPVPVPVPVPPPVNPYFARPQLQPQQQQSQPQPQQQYDPYDQNFFIGTPQPVGPPTFAGQPQSVPSNGLPQTPIPMKPVSTQPATSQVSATPTFVSTNIPRNLDNFVPSNRGGPIAESKEDIAKLFQDKKITLSEFLAITAKPEVTSSSPAHLQEKIKVISRCQEAIKILGANEKKYTGKLVVQRTSHNYKASGQKNKSPLTRMPPVIFPFTQHQIKKEQKMTFTTFINQLLQKIGVMKEAIVDVEKGTSPNAGIPPAGRNLSPPPPPLITRNTSFREATIPRSHILGNNQLSKMVQTEIFKCESCEKRKKILYMTSAVQCGGDKANFSVSTQVSESDFYSKIPITQSIASLTPAQLLAKSRSGLDSSTSPAKFSRSLDKDDYDILPTKSNFNTLRGSFPRLIDNYGLPRYNPPSPSHYNIPTHEEPVPSSSYNNLTSLRTQFSGGGGRGRAPQSNPSRPPAPNRFGYNYF